ncbi:Na/Pi cotransporter family protein [Reinekea marinisedimentorum]|uniref:Phosphate:Na+ symporter n=1 Tax=Reinekea marinisedimentorum TaxID=230495 RepID=A0A4R3I275_9GAMM|nr:Na/Pi symporter [Reinekea marinisedimentorum]TCS38735.1 phosphate:Na+ symporter [Reinekea marinisedimentorum]
MVRRLFLFSGLIFLFGSLWWTSHVQQIGAGVAIFLFGMLSMDEGFRAFTGGTLERLLSVSTNRLWKSVSFGVLSTTLVQSSSLISVITISFLSSGLLQLSQGIGIILGANIGTTTGAWLVAAVGLKVKISAYAMPMLMVGIVLVMQSHKSLKGIGHILTGLGFLFLGIYFMKEGFDAFRSAIDLTRFAVEGWQGLLLFTFFGLLATVIMQSSHATLVLIITALASNQITYDNAIALAIGANIGTTVTAVIGAIGSNAAGRQLAAAHLVFNGITALVALIFIQQLIQSVEFLSALFGIGATDYTLKLSLFHTIFNVLGVALILPFVHKLAALLRRIISDDRRQQLTLPVHRKDMRNEEVQTQFLSKSVMAHPDTGVKAILSETGRLWDNAIAVIAYSLYLNRSDIESEQKIALAVISVDANAEKTDVEELYSRYIRPLNAAIFEAANQLPKPLSEAQAETIFKIKLACRDLMNAVKDTKHLQKNVHKFNQHENVEIRKQYRNIRKQLATVLNRLQQIMVIPEEEEALVAFAEVQQALQKQDILSNGELDQLIARGKIPRTLISSLMNDSQYCLDIGQRLIQMAQTLYWCSSGNERSAAESLILENDEVA